MSVINVLYGSAPLTVTLAAIFFIIIAIAALISLVCYILYYRLEPNAGYVTGMIPLIIAALVMTGITICFIF